MLRRSSLGWPITLAVVMIVLVVLLTVGWVVVTAIGALNAESPGPYWAVLAVGTTFLVLVLVGTVLYLILSIKEIRLNQRQSNFMDAVTHELKSPIASLKLYLQTLDRRTVSEQQQADFHRFMFQDLERLDSLIDHLLDAARSDKPPEGDEENVDLPAVLQSCVEAARARYRLADEAIRLTTDPATVRARPMDLEILFRNLIDNAIKYSGAAPQVEIEVKLNGQGVVTTIADNGPGIPAGMRSKIFGRFVRLGNELERTQTGTGLGLYIVRTLVKQLKGSIDFHDRIAKPGTLFEVTLPVVRRSAMKHLLIVEDEEHLAIGMKYNFEAEGYDVTAVGDGQAALAKMEDHEHPVDLVILDLMLPGMSGYSVCEKIRAAGNDVPILMLSARTLSEDRTRGFDVGTDQYLHKPFDLEELLSRVKNLLARQERRAALPAQPPGDEYAFGCAKVNFDTFHVTVEGRSLKLSALEMKLLRYFVEHEGSVVTRNELLEQVWGFGKSPTTRTVDNFVLNLRKYFERDPAVPEHFLSVRGAGYRFVAAGEKEVPEEPATESPP